MTTIIPSQPAFKQIYLFEEIGVKVGNNFYCDYFSQMERKNSNI